MTAHDHDSLSDRLKLAVAIAQEAGQLTLSHFRSRRLQVERKADDSPVTVADRQAEELLRKRIAEHFPDDAILGEEFGETAGTTGFRWVLDPIDGTKSFIHGIPLYTTLVAVLHDDQPQLGVVHAPACHETIYAARGEGCWYIDERTGPREPVRVNVSETARLEEGLLLTSEVASFQTDRSPAAFDAYLELQQQMRLARTWGDAYGYLMVATGRADVMIDPIMNLWDAAPLQPIIEEAGGVFCDWQGRPTVHSNEAVATNRLLSEQVLGVLRGH
jgi:histidinol phosphatase-like enzyme (inositol monophosphatase family)